nr:PREDICTED: molybdopterin synthase sulfur carrier subunit-like [Opisthocomus hoazin]
MELWLPHVMCTYREHVQRMYNACQAADVLAVIRDQVVFAVRQEYVLLGDQLLVLQPGDEVAIIPPISGG